MKILKHPVTFLKFILAFCYFWFTDPLFRSDVNYRRWGVKTGDIRSRCLVCGAEVNNPSLPNFPPDWRWALCSLHEGWSKLKTYPTPAFKKAMQERKELRWLRPTNDTDPISDEEEEHWKKVMLSAEKRYETDPEYKKFMDDSCDSAYEEFIAARDKALAESGQCKQIE